MRVLALQSLLLAALLASADPVLAQENEFPAPVSWTSDARDFAIGSVFRVVIIEETVAEDVGTATNTELRSLGLGGSATMDGIPLGPEVAVAGDLERRERMRDDIRRRGQFLGELAVRVVGIDSAGLLEVEGERELKIDNRSRTFTLHGYVRPEDVLASDLVYSTRIVDARIAYQGGPSKMRGGWLGRLLTWLWPF